jgi:uncharacterized protein (DUF58 family)
MFYAGASLQLQGYVIFAYVAAIWWVALAIAILVRPRVRCRAYLAERVCAGETMPVDLEIEPASRVLGKSDLVVLPHRLPGAVDSIPDGGVPIPPLARGQSQRVRLGLKCKQRGVYTLRGFRVETDFPFGLLRSRRTFEAPRALLVYPKFTRIARLNLPTGRRYQPGGVALASNLGESFEFIGNREYREGDNIRDIDWRATARLTIPIVREYRDEYFMRVGVILDTHVPRGAAKSSADAFERAVSVAASVSDYMSRQDYLVDLFAAGPNLYHLTAGRSLAYLDQILDILACVNASPVEPFDVIEPEIAENLAQITTMICIFLDWNDSRRAFVQRLAQQGAGVKVIVVRDGPCTVDPSVEADGFGAIPVISGELNGMALDEL